MAHKTTIYDIAKKLGITAATVSRALNDHPRISEATKKMVMSTAREMNYVPNKLALALKNGKSTNVGVVVPFINRHFFSNVIRGIEEELYPKGYNVIICQTHDEEQRERDIIQNLMNSQVEGIIISIARTNTKFDHLEQVLKKGLPMVFFDRKRDMEGVVSVAIDDFQGGYDATMHLVKQGCRTIAHLRGDRTLEIYWERFKGYQQALKDSGLAYREELVLDITSVEEEGLRAAQRLMAVENPPDAIFSSSDYGALGAIKWLVQKGYRIPDDICVVGFSNEPFTQIMDLSISSVDQSPMEMGRMAARVFLDGTDVTDTAKTQKRVVLSPTLMVRDSSLRDSGPVPSPKVD
ncbi:MAG: LacI family DNA-binding transcriptional regulator [Flavobacteriaceae bacterium]